MTDNNKKMLKEALEILYNMNHLVNLAYSVGITIEDGGNRKDIGHAIYGSMTSADNIIRDIIKTEYGIIYDDVDDDPLTVLYDDNNTKENIIEQCLNILCKIGEETDDND